MCIKKFDSLNQQGKTSYLFYKKYKIFILILLFSIFISGGLISAKETENKDMTISGDIQNMINLGEYANASIALKQAAEKADKPELKKFFLDQADILTRIRRDFKKNLPVILEELKAEIPDATTKDVFKWLSAGALEGKLIDGELLFFNNAVANLFRIDKAALARRDAFKKSDEGRKKSEQELQDPGNVKKEEYDLNKYKRMVLDAAEKSSDNFVMPQMYKAKYTITVNPDLVPEGEVIRCWMPFPRNTKYSRDVRFVSSKPEVKLIAPEEALQRTLYFEHKVTREDKEKEIIFTAEWDFTSYAFGLKIDPTVIKPYDKNSAIYKNYTKELPPHIVFTDEIKKRTEEIIAGETNPYLKAKKIYQWMNDNIPWTSAIEYSTIPNVSSYCYENMRGDCGIQSLLYMTMCRIAGIPSKWQSGWTIAPGHENLHDWAEIYLEPYGWVPVDISRGLTKHDDEGVKWFNFCNIDAFRMYVNDDYSQALFPPKEHFRSEPIDFQRGEVEWKGGNLYFDKWKYSLELTRVNPAP